MATPSHPNIDITEENKSFEWLEKLSICNRPLSIDVYHVNCSKVTRCKKTIGPRINSFIQSTIYSSLPLGARARSLYGRPKFLHGALVWHSVFTSRAHVHAASNVQVRHVGARHWTVEPLRPITVKSKLQTDPYDTGYIAVQNLTTKVNSNILTTSVMTFPPPYWQLTDSGLPFCIGSIIFWPPLVSPDL